MIVTTVPLLATLPLVQRDAFGELERTAETHAGLQASLACLNTVEVGGAPSGPPALVFPFTVAAWNLERCLFPEESAGKLQATGAPLVLLSEMDQGMARTSQRHPAAEIAATLSMHYAYGVEFIEMGLGSEIERAFCTDDVNEKGFHGNALMASVPLHRPFMLRLAGDCLWFLDGGDQPRIGGRNAVGAVIKTVDGPFVAVSVHLESVADGPYRERQVAGLIDAIEAFAPGLPILIGGDLNTGNHNGGDFENDTLFAMAQARGFVRHGGPLDQPSTRPSLITRFPERAMKLDWFLGRGLVIGDSHLVPSLTETGKPLSDHDMVVCTVEGLA